MSKLNLNSKPKINAVNKNVIMIQTLKYVLKLSTNSSKGSVGLKNSKGFMELENSVKTSTENSIRQK